jgi:hypothetical protein
MKIEFDQVCALVIFLACCLLLVFKVDGEVKAAMTLAVGYMIGTGYQARRKGKGG